MFMVSMIKKTAELSFGRKYNVKKIIPELLCWIEMNIDRPLSVNDIVLKSGYSAFYLHHVFTSVTGESIGRYIRRRKLAAAACLLRDCDAYINDIAFSAGFYEMSTFYRSFRREFGITPGEYRKRWIESVNIIVSETPLSESVSVAYYPEKWSEWTASDSRWWFFGEHLYWLSHQVSIKKGIWG